ncbi:hypothetical protein QE152_g9156 [Popillia japonica]|uniref:Uncharacterized protein n=1 Tax=Popillia japonica TaxID=7064 RepID=A0AAW1M0K9_POPJA
MYIERLEKNENVQIKKENEGIKKELIDMKMYIERLEKEKRKNNIVVKGLEIREKELEKIKELINSFVKEQLGITAEIKTATKLREKIYVIELHKEDDKKQIMQNKRKLRDLKMEKIFIDNDLGITAEIKTATKLREKIYIIELHKEDDKKQIMQNERKLRDLKMEKIFIDNDLTKKEREKQQHIRLRAQEERRKGNDVDVGFNKITINGIEWRWNNSNTQLERKGSKN